MKDRKLTQQPWYDKYITIFALLFVCAGFIYLIVAAKAPAKQAINHNNYAEAKDDRQQE